MSEINNDMNFPKGLPQLPADYWKASAQQEPADIDIFDANLKNTVNQFKNQSIFDQNK